MRNLDHYISSKNVSDVIPVFVASAILSFDLHWAWLQSEPINIFPSHQTLHE